MRLPDQLQSAIEKIVESASPKVLKKAQEELTRDYKEGKSSLFNDEAKRLVYLAARMPATFAAIYKVLQHVPFEVSSFLDIGAGPGTASWAAAELFPLKKVILIEQSHDAIALGRELAREYPISQEWIQRSLPGSIPKADVAVISYMLNEVPMADEIIKAAWDAVHCLVIIEPGTMRGAAIIRKAREQLLGLGAHVVAPCPHSLTCPSDWCHFSARVERTRLHRQIKGGTLGHEDEKFSYFIAAKTAVPLCKNRIVRHPMKGSGHIRFTVCAESGNLEEKVITRSDKEMYRKARDSEWGDQM
jgi:ribosomal protein RSM22 (predicted rRNA methylase)